MIASRELEAATAELGAKMEVCETCPCCGGAALEPVPCRNDLHGMAYVHESMKDSDYHACLDCSLIFARRRQSQENAALFYKWFIHLENRSYAVYPPPENYVRAKSKTAQSLVAYLIEQGVLSDGMRIAHIRSDVGSFMLAIQEKFPNCRIHGFDYFDSNIRYARAQGLCEVTELDPARLCLHEEPGYDLVICNHVLTHAFDPSADLKTLYKVIKPGGALFLYNEADHLLRFQPDSAHYQWVALNNFHKQLLTPHSLDKFLLDGGFAIEHQGHRKFYMQRLARKKTVVPTFGESQDIARAAREIAPVMVRNFRRWAKVQQSPILGLIKTTTKLRSRCFNLVDRANGQQAV